MPEDRADQWRYHGLLVDLHKFYVDVALKANVFYYAVTGGILTYYLAHRGDRGMAAALVLPLALSLALAALAWKGARLAGVLRDELVSVSRGLGLPTYPEASTLGAFLRLSAVLLLGVAVALVALLLGA